MTRLPQSDHSADDLNATFNKLSVEEISSTYPNEETRHINAAFKELKIEEISSTSTNGERNDQYLVSTNPCGFSFVGHFWAELGTAKQTVEEEKATEIITETPADAAKITDSHVTVTEIDKAREEAAYQKALKECSSLTPLHE